MSETEVVQKVFEALNANDTKAAVSYFSEDVVRTEYFSGTETWRGLSELQQHIAGGRSQWAEGSCTPVEMKLEGNVVTVTTNVRVRLKGREEWNTGTVYDVFSFRNGKISEWTSSLTRRS